MVKVRIIEVKKCHPTRVTCDPQEKFPSELKHEFEATKVYSVIYSDGSESGIAICPTHLFPISAKLVYKSVAH
jgi:hypothetical protein